MLPCSAYPYIQSSCTYTIACSGHMVWLSILHHIIHEVHGLNLAKTGRTSEQGCGWCT